MLEKATVPVKKHSTSFWISGLIAIVAIRNDRSLATATALESRLQQMAARWGFSYGSGQATSEWRLWYSSCREALFYQEMGVDALSGNALCHEISHYVRRTSF